MSSAATVSSSGSKESKLPVLKVKLDVDRRYFAILGALAVIGDFLVGQAAFILAFGEH
jgi:hypothetical protein